MKRWTPLWLALYLIATSSFFYLVRDPTPQRARWAYAGVMALSGVCALLATDIWRLSRRVEELEREVKSQ